MPRRLRIEFEGAIYHVMARGNARQVIVRDDEDRQRLLTDLERVVTRSGWELLAFVVMNNHFHLLLRTPRPNLGKGMQAFLSSYAQWWGRRRGRAGHLFQGRYRAEMIEDERYYWAVSRYIHLNPVRARMVERPESWAWSSYPGYAKRSDRLPWVAHDTLLSAWRGKSGGGEAAAARAYRKFVEAGLKTPPPSPFREAFGGWILGSEGYVARLRSLAALAVSYPPSPEALHLSGLDAGAVFQAVADHYGLDLSSLSVRGDAHIARAVAAALCRRHTESTLHDLAARLGLSRADSVPNLTRRFEARLLDSPKLARDVQRITKRLFAKTKKKG